MRYAGGMPTKTTAPKLNPRTADKHVLYQLAVQAPETDSKFFARHFKKVSGRDMRVFREDFCGTAILSCHVVKNHRENRAIGVDLHRPTLDWGRKHNLPMLTEEQRSRLELIEGDVLNTNKPKADLIAALNFSYCIFKSRELLRAYFENAFKSLKPGGMLILDSWGGSETQTEQEEERDVDEDGYQFTYVWDQHKFDPITYHSTCKIHFEFEDGSRMKNAFVYDWRLWTLPEMRELMEDAGFEDIHVLWEGTDKETQSGNGVFRRVKRGEADDAWIAYLVGSRKK